MDMTRQEEQFLQAAQKDNLEYVKEHINQISPEVLQRAFVYTPSVEISKYLLENNKVKIDAYVQETGTNTKVTALYKACQENNKAKVSFLVTAGADVNLPVILIEKGLELKGETPFMHVAKAQNFALMLALVDNQVDKIDIGYKDAQGKTIQDVIPYVIRWLRNYRQQILTETFLQAAEKGEIRYIWEHIDHVDTKTRIKAFVHTPLVEVAKLLNFCGVDINAVEKGNGSQGAYWGEWEHTALTIACQNRETEKALWLIKQGANVNQLYYHRVFVGNMNDIDDEDILSPLMCAVQNNNTVLVSALLKAGCDINFKGHIGRKGTPNKTALDLAAEEGNTEIINILESFRAKAQVSSETEEITQEPVTDLQEKQSTINTPNPKNTALYNAIWAGNAKEAKALLEQGADVNAVDRFQESVLMCAVKNRHVEIVKLLLAAGANVNFVNRFQESVLMRAVKNGHVEIAKLLIDAWADVNSVDSSQRSVLMQAVMGKHVEIAKLLIDAGADVNVVDRFKESVLMRAVAWGCQAEMIKLLIDAGANVNYKDNVGRSILQIAEQNGSTEIVDLLKSAGAKE